MKKIIVLVITLLISACTTDHGTFTVMSNKIVNVKDFELDKTDITKKVKGSDTSHIIVFFPTKSNPNISGALKDAFDQADGDVMTDVNVYTKFWYIPYIYGQSSWNVDGDVVKTRN